jgi:hypothetical protein
MGGGGVKIFVISVSGEQGGQFHFWTPRGLSRGKAGEAQKRKLSAERAGWTPTYIVEALGRDEAMEKAQRMYLARLARQSRGRL